MENVNNVQIEKNDYSVREILGSTLEKFETAIVIINQSMRDGNPVPPQILQYYNNIILSCSRFNSLNEKINGRFGI